MHVRVCVCVHVCVCVDNLLASHFSGEVMREIPARSAPLLSDSTALYFNSEYNVQKSSNDRPFSWYCDSKSCDKSLENSEFKVWSCDLLICFDPSNENSTGTSMCNDLNAISAW